MENSVETEKHRIGQYRIEGEIEASKQKRNKKNTMKKRRIRRESKNKEKVKL